MRDRAPISRQRAEHAAELLKLLGHPVRLRIVELLDLEQELTVSEIHSGVGVSQSTVSQHLSRMKARGILSSRREGTRVVYSIREPQVVRMLQCVRECQI